MADHAIARIRMLHAVAPDKPWVRYYAPGTAHAPHHAPKDWIAKFKGQFDMGWDKMREVTLAQQKAAGDRSAGHAADAAAQSDSGVGLARRRPQEGLCAHDGSVRRGACLLRLPRWAASSTRIEDMGELDNTLIIYIQGDNGASAEGTLQGLLNEMSVFNGMPEDFKQVIGAYGRPRRADDVQPLSRRLGARHGHAVSVDQAGRLAFRRHAQRPGHLLARAHQGQRRHPHAVPPVSSTSIRPSSKPSACNRPRCSTACRRSRSRA